MKLSSGHIESINDKLDESALIFDDFKTEMLDHICSAIENKYSDEDDFEVALHNEFYAFQDQYVESNNLLEKGTYYTGIKALEMERFISVDKRIKKAFLKKVKSQVWSYRIVFWLITYAVFYLSVDLWFDYFQESFGSSFISGMLLGSMILAIHQLFGNMPIYRFEPQGLFMAFKGIHRSLKPTSPPLHSLRKLIWVPILMVTVIYNIHAWGLQLHYGISTFFLVILGLSIYCLLGLYRDIKRNQLG